ncbi:MAG: deoxyribose-phosphate aldolase [Crocinitomicaceae bacterium]|nr:deoxyribose-phosphate aldolase [Crocinitomicaceae bacterium]
MSGTIISNQKVHPERVPILPLDLKYLNYIRANTSAINRRTDTLTKRRTVKKEWQAAWLLKAITLIDLTTLSGDDTPGNVERLCAKAINPVRPDLLEAMGMANKNIHTGAVCVYHNLIETASRCLSGTNIPIAAVSTGFPAGQIPIEQKLEEIERSVKAGAKEIDIVVSRANVLRCDWKALYDELVLFRKACGDAHMKTILATGDLVTLERVARASYVAMLAGSDFIKTSTGKETVNATLPVSLVMIRAIRDFHEETGYKVGFKPAGGIQKAKQSLDWLILMKEELGREWLEPELFRFGASSLLADIERQLEHYVTGRYSADYRHPMA